MPYWQYLRNSLVLCAGSVLGNLDPERFAHDDDWHVFVRVNDEETNSNFPEEGYYQVVHVTPEDCRELFKLG